MFFSKCRSRKNGLRVKRRSSKRISKHKRTSRRRSQKRSSKQKNIGRKQSRKRSRHNLREKRSRVNSARRSRKRSSKRSHSSLKRSRRSERYTRNKKNTRPNGNPESLYSRLLNTDLRGIKFINFPHINGKLKTYRKAAQGTEVAWKDIRCNKTFRIGNLTIKTDCVSGTKAGKAKVFIREYQNLYEYAKAIQSGEVSRRTHKEMWRFVLNQARNLGMNPINHNLDVNTLHFKFR